MSTADLIKRCFCPPSPPLTFAHVEGKSPSFAVLHSCAVTKLITHLCLSPVCHLWFWVLIPLCLKTLRSGWGGWGGFWRRPEQKGNAEHWTQCDGCPEGNPPPGGVTSRGEIWSSSSVHKEPMVVRSGAGGVAGGGAHAHVLKLARTGGESDVSAPLQGSPALIYCMSPEQV